MSHTLSSRPLLSVPQVAERLYLSEKSVWRLLDRGVLPRLKFGATTRIHPDDVDAHIVALRNGNA